jgi:hypothetical protein
MLEELSSRSLLIMAIAKKPKPATPTGYLSGGSPQGADPGSGAQAGAAVSRLAHDGTVPEGRPDVASTSLHLDTQHLKHRPCPIAMTVRRVGHPFVPLVNNAFTSSQPRRCACLAGGSLRPTGVKLAARAHRTLTASAPRAPHPGDGRP